MNVARIVGCALVALVASASHASAQPFKWWQDDKVKTELGLTPDQSAKLEGVFQASMTPQRKYLEELDRQEKQFSALLLKDDTTEAEVMRQAAQVEVLRSELSKAHTLMLFRMNRILTPEQRVKVNEMHNRREGDRNRRNEPPIKK
jgi:Spy/CpxP family protein refolding chaperone